MKIKFINSIPRLILVGTVINNYIKVRREFIIPSIPIYLIQDLLLLINSKLNKHIINFNFEAGVYLSHLRVTKSNDRILSVGLGNGLSLISIVKLLDSSKGGYYRCIEASESQIAIAKENIEINNVNMSSFEIINGFAGKEIFDSYGKSSQNNVDINRYEFEILELDCEGSELSILSSLSKCPRNIIVELHPRHFHEDYRDFDKFINFMNEKGYEYLFAYGHNGDPLDIEYARKYYNSTNTSGINDECIEDRNIHFFSSCPIVITFAYNPH